MKTTILIFKVCLFFIVCLFFGGNKMMAQTMTAGDIAFIGYNTGGQDGFAFIALTNLPAGETLYLTEQGWDGNGWMTTLNEPHLAYVIPSGITCGKIISFVETAPDIITVYGGGSVTFAQGSNFNLSGGDQILAYQSATTVAPASPKFIAGVHGDYNSTKYDPVTTWNPVALNSTYWATSDCALPPGLTNGVNCISLYPAPGPEQFNAKFNGSLIGSATTLRAAINNPANWSKNNSTTSYPITPTDYPTPVVSCVTCTSPTVPILSSTVTTVLCNGSSRTINISGTLNSATEWKVYSGSCGGTLVTSTSSTSFIVSPTSTTTYYVRGEGGCVTPGPCATFTVTVNPALTASTSQVKIACNGASTGSATVTPAGGATPYTYLWSPSGGTSATATGLAMGTYTVTVTDNIGCTTTATATITEPSTAVSATVVTTIACNGGSTGAIDVTPSGGTAPYTFNWGDGITTEDRTGLAPGSYTVTITDANGCEETITATVLQGLSDLAVSKPSVTYEKTFVQGTYYGPGSPNFDDWITFLNNIDLTANYTALIISGSKLTNEIELNDKAAISQIATALHNGTSTTVVVGGNTWRVGQCGSYHSYNNSELTFKGTGICSCSADVTIRPSIGNDNWGGVGNTCYADTQSFRVEFKAGPTITNVSCNGGTDASIIIDIDSGAPPYTYTWSPGNPVGQGTNAIRNLAAGTYTVMVTDANGCSITESFDITEPPVLNATADTQTNVSCNGGSNGSTTVAVTGGTGTYTYLWAPSGGTAATATGLAAGTYTVTVTDANGCQATQSFTITQPSALVASPDAQTNVSCNGGSNGSATVAVTGGTGTYTYLWAPSGGTAATATGLAAGTYTVTVTDANSCQATQSFTIAQPSALGASPDIQTNVSCNGGSNGSAAVTVTGGTTPYTYSWTPSGGTAAAATGLAAGTYTVTVTDENLCTATQSFTILQPPALIASAGTQENVSCNGGNNGSAAVTVTGGIGRYTYSWAPSGGRAAAATGLAAGTYTVTVTDDNLCTATQSFTILQPPALIASAGTQENVSCNGGNNGSAAVTVTGGTGNYTYSWAPSGGTAAVATGLATGTYTVTVTDANSCQTTQSFTITEPSALAASPDTQTNVSCNGGSNGSAAVTVTGGTGTYTYSWTPSGGTAATATGLTAGTYTVTVTDANGCQATQSFTITQPSALAASSDTQTNVSCNGGSNGSAAVTVTGGTGTYTYSWAPSGGTAPTATGLTAGTYTVTVTDANGCQATQSFTITQPSALAASPDTQTNVSCNGGSNGLATVTVTGGTGTYTYSWAPAGGTAATATGLTAGTYTVTVTDANNCEVTQSFAITQPSALAATTSASNVSCPGHYDGTAVINVTGGTTPYTYLWNNGAVTNETTGLTAGVYVVKVTDANGCKIEKQVFVNTTPDTTAPVPNKASLPTITKECAVTTADIPVPTANDNCVGTVMATTTDELIYTEQGTYTITWTYNDGNGNRSTQLQTVIVKDITKPIPAVSILPTITKECAVMTTDIAVPTANDNCVGIITATTTDALVYTEQGTYTINWTYNDGNGNTTTQQQTIVVDDITKPVPTIATLPTITKECAVTTADILVPTANDNCVGTVMATTTDALVYTEQGTYTINWTYNDGNGNTTTQQQTIVVDDVTVPVPTIASLPTITKECAVTTADIPVPTANDNCVGIITATTTDALVYTEQGTYTINWTYNDGNGNTTTQEQTIVVDDITKPVPTIASLPTITKECAVTTTDIPVPTANDNCVGIITATTADALVYTEQGTYTINWTYNDGNGNTTTQEQTIVVDDITKPVPTIASLPTITKECAVTTLDIPVPTANDNCVGIIIATTNDPLTYTEQGTYTINWTYNDGNGNTTTQQQTIVVDDVTAPVPTIASLPTITKECAVMTTDIAVPTANDNCVGIITATTNDPLTYTEQGTYTINWTYNDGNGNTTTQQQTIVVDDVTAPVPTIASLPTITKECAVTTLDIPVPTANDNCVGIITATTTDALVYTEQGTYTINWTYNDGNGNITMQQQTVIVEESPLADIVLNDITTVYDGTVHNLMVDNMPAGAAVSYSITPLAEEDNGAVNAGVYTVTAVVTPPVSAVNCEAVTLTAELVIEKAMQTIVFDELEVVLLEEAEDFQLSATASSGLPVDYTYTYNQSTPAATVSPQGWVEIMHSGSVLITAHQQGNSNYLPAASVDRSLVINSKDASIQQIVINGEVYTNPDETVYYMLDCDDVSNEVVVQIDAEFGATVSPARDFVIGVPKPGVYRQTIELVSENGASVERYQIIVERPFAFDDIVVQKFDNTLLINNNPQTNGGYRFVKYEWYKNDVLTGTEQVYSAGNSKQDILDENALYRAVLTTENGDVIHTCATKITRKNNFKINVYPNPVRVNEQLEVVFDYPSSAFKGATAALYTTSGKLVQSVKLNENVSSIKLPAGISEGIYMLVLQIEGRQETIKVVVKQ